MSKPIKRLGSPYWQYDFKYNKERHQGSTETTDREAAKEFISHLREELRQKKLFKDEKKEKLEMTLEEAFDLYHSEVSAHTGSANNHKAYIRRLLALGASKKLSEITDKDVSVLVANRRNMKARHKKELVSNATVNRETELLSRVFRRAKLAWKVNTGEINWSEHYLEEAEERVRELNPEEEAKLFTHLRVDFQPMVRFAIASGMRLANIVRLTWGQVDFGTGQITIKMKSRKPGGRTHTLPITPRMHTMLRLEKGNNPIFVFTYVCAKGRGKRKKGERYPFSHDGWRKSWNEALGKAGIEDFRFHDNRHTAATRIVRASGNLKAAQKLLGHTDIATTARYAHVTQEDLYRAMLQVEGSHYKNDYSGEKQPPKIAKVTLKIKELKD